MSIFICIIVYFKRMKYFLSISEVKCEIDLRNYL